MKLTLTRPLVFFDLETTGLDVLHDRIVEISLLKLATDGTVDEQTWRVNPEQPIAAEATAVHHITDADVAEAPTFKELAPRVADFFEGCDIAGFNSQRFDLPMLSQEMERAGVRFELTDTRLVDVQTIYHKKEPRNLAAAYRFYCGGELSAAHSASADTRATYEVLMAQLEHYEDLPSEIGALAEFASQHRNVDLLGRLIYDDQKREVINFGKFKGQVAEDVLRREPAYYSWVMRGDFAKDTKDAFTRIYLRTRRSSKK